MFSFRAQVRNRRLYHPTSFGSSDLWAIGQIPNTQDTGKTGSVSYAVGQASGPILTTPLTFAGFNVTSQAFSRFFITPVEIITFALTLGVL